MSGTCWWLTYSTITFYNVNVNHLNAYRKPDHRVPETVDVSIGLLIGLKTNYGIFNHLKLELCWKKLFSSISYYFL